MQVRDTHLLSEEGLAQSSRIWPSEDFWEFCPEGNCLSGEVR